jgi:hypothetical protein
VRGPWLDVVVSVLNRWSNALVLCSAQIRRTSLRGYAPQIVALHSSTSLIVVEWNRSSWKATEGCSAGLSVPRRESKRKVDHGLGQQGSSRINTHHKRR